MFHPNSDKVLLNSSATSSGGGNRYSLDDTHFGEGEVRVTISSPVLTDVGNYTVEAAVGDGSVADRITLAFTMEGRAVGPRLPHESWLSWLGLL